MKGSVLLNLLSNAGHIRSCVEALVCRADVDMIIYRTGPQEKESIVRRTCNLLDKSGIARGTCGMMGDAANDTLALAVREAVTICMAHGAAPCRANADLVVREPGDVVVARERYGPVLLSGSALLAEDVTFTSALTAGLAFMGVWNLKFQRLALGLLYEDVWSVLPMQVFSSGFWPISALLCIFARSHMAFVPQVMSTRLIIRLVGGLVLGLVLGAAGPRSTPEIWGDWALACIWLVTLMRHLGYTIGADGNHMARQVAIGLQIIGIIVVSFAYINVLTQAWQEAWWEFLPA